MLGKYGVDLECFVFNVLYRTCFSQIGIRYVFVG